MTRDGRQFLHRDVQELPQSRGVTAERSGARGLETSPQPSRKPEGAHDCDRLAPRRVAKETREQFVQRLRSTLTHLCRLRHRVGIDSCAQVILDAERKTSRVYHLGTKIGPVRGAR
jgi:hypothetical protein